MNRKNNNRLKPITFRAEASYHERLNQIMKWNGVNKTDAIKGLIDAGYFVGRADTTTKIVDLMDAIEDVRVCCTDAEAYQKLYKAGGALCQYLSPN